MARDRAVRSAPVTIAELLALLGRAWSRLALYPGGLAALAALWLAWGRPKTEDQRPKTEDARRETNDERPRAKDQGPRAKDRRSVITMIFGLRSSVFGL